MKSGREKSRDLPVSVHAKTEGFPPDEAVRILHGKEVI
jgi:hypothetical protein